MRSSTPGIVLAGMLLWAQIGGCQSAYRKSLERIDTPLIAGDMAQAGETAYREFQSCTPDERDHVVRALDAGTVLLMAGRRSESMEALASAYACERPFLDTTAEASITRGIAHFVFNPTVGTYQSSCMERILLNTFLAVNQLVAGDSALARLEFNRAEDWQHDAEARRAGETDEHEDSTPKVSTRDVRARGLLDDLDNAPDCARYQSPWTSYLRAVFLLSTSRELGDRETARTELQRVRSESPECHALVDDELKTVEAKSGLPTTWVFVMSGLSPRKTERRLDFPLGNGRKAWVALPRLSAVEGFTDAFQISGDRGSSRAHMLMDVERSVKADYKARIGPIIDQEFQALSTRGFWTLTVMSGDKTTYEASSAEADLRLWRTLPKRIYVARILTPSNGKISVSAGDGTKATIGVDSRESNGVLIWQTQPGTAMASIQWSMKP